MGGRSQRGRESGVFDLRTAAKIDEMIEYAYVVLRHFPKSERHILSQEIRRSLWSLQRAAVAAGKIAARRKHTTGRLQCQLRDRERAHLESLDVEVELLRRRLRLAKSMRGSNGEPILPFDKYENWSNHLSEVGKMLGSWIQSLNRV